MRKHAPIPTPAIRKAAAAGPITRVAFARTLFRLTAFVTSSRPTISVMNACRVGLSMAFTMPSANTIHSWTALVTTSTPSRSASAPAVDCVATRRRRLSTRSAMTPPYAPPSSIGVNCSAVTAPSAKPLPVSRRTSQPCATHCIHVPVIETSWPAKYRR